MGSWLPSGDIHYILVLAEQCVVFVQRVQGWSGVSSVSMCMDGCREVQGIDWPPNLHVRPRVEPQCH